MATKPGVSLVAAFAREYSLRIVCSLAASWGVWACIVCSPNVVCDLSALGFAGVEQLCFPRDRRTGGACAFGEDLGEVFEILGARPIALKFSCHRQPGDRLGARRNESADAHVVCLRRHAAGGICNDINIVAVAHC